MSGTALLMPTRHAWAWRLSIFALAFTVLALRRPDALLHAQFYAEDGAIWFADAYNYGGLRALFYPYNGYLHLVPRVAGAIATAVPRIHAPLVENVIGIAIQAVPASILLSRMSAHWGSVRYRAVLAALYLLLPNTREMAGTVTESPWVTALCAFLIMVAAPPQRKFLGAVALLVCSLNGPFCIFLLPFALYRLWSNQKDPWRRLVAATLGLGSLIQGLIMLTQAASRPHPTLGMSTELFVRILAGQVYLCSLLGTSGLAILLSWRTLSAVAVVGTLAVILGYKADPKMRPLLLFCALLFAAVLLHPVTPVSGPAAWRTLAMATSTHYWFLPSLAFVWSLASCISCQSKAARWIGGLLLCLLPVGIVRDYRYPAFADLHYAAYAGQAPPIAIPENPAGWELLLTTSKR